MTTRGVDSWSRVQTVFIEETPVTDHLGVELYCTLNTSIQGGQAGVSGGF